MSSWRPTHQRTNPKALLVLPVPTDVDLAEVAGRCEYVGSPYHKDRPGFAGMPAQRVTAGSRCPTDLADDRATVQRWLEEAIISGNTGRWDDEHRYPLDVFHRVNDIVFQAKTDRNGTGQYHGFPLEAWQTVQGLEE